ncbi:16410_t:CDS:2, partial [Gigaspora margarita]
IISVIHSYEHDKALWILINSMDIFISAHFAFVIAAYAARHSPIKENNLSISKSHGIDYLN